MTGSPLILKGLGAVALALALASGAHAAPASCERTCLVGLADKYADALVAHDPGRLPTAPQVKFTENLVPLKFGQEGLWRTAIITGVSLSLTMPIQATSPRSGSAA